MITLGIYDFYAYVTGGNYSTISRVMHNSSIESPTIILVIGYLLGHFFSPIQKDQ